jgi:hypothetical protein
MLTCTANACFACMQVALIVRRQECIEALLGVPQKLETLRESAQHLRGYPDVQRLSTRAMSVDVSNSR